jgi:hypothetical protein
MRLKIVDIENLMVLFACIDRDGYRSSPIMSPKHCEMYQAGLIDLRKRVEVAYEERAAKAGKSS